MTTTREAALEAALRPFAAAYFNDNGDVTIDTGHITTTHYRAADKALSTPATEPQGYVEGLEAVLEIVADGHSKDYTDNCILARQALAARPAPQPAADTRVVAAALWREEAVNAGAPGSVAAGRTLASFSEQSPELQARWTKFAACAIRAIIGTATPTPSDKIAEAARVLLEWWNTIDQDDPDMDVVLEIMGIMNGSDDDDRFDAALRALAGQG